MNVIYQRACRCCQHQHGNRSVSSIFSEPTHSTTGIVYWHFPSHYTAPLSHTNHAESAESHTNNNRIILTLSLYTTFVFNKRHDSMLTFGGACIASDVANLPRNYLRDVTMSTGRSNKCRMGFDGGTNPNRAGQPKNGGSIFPNTIY
jgi:hypothetical protein